MVTEVSEGELERLLEEEDATLIDVRDRAKHREGHVPGSVPISPGEMLDQVSSLKDQLPVVLVAEEEPERAASILTGHVEVEPEDVLFFDVGNWTRDLVSGEGDAGCREVSPREARKLLRNGARLVDVRTRREHEMLRIPGGENLPFNELARADLDPDEPLLLYCNSGRKSRSAAEVAAGKGVGELYNLEPGIKGWLKEGFPVEGTYAEDSS